MSNNFADLHNQFAALAARYGVSVGAVESLAAALKLSGGKQAQFNHPELGGMGQWMPGMIMVGDMFNTALKARIDGLATELVPLVTMMPSSETSAFSKFTESFDTAWWNSSLGTPNSSGGQNNWHYAYFANVHRLLINEDGRIKTYDTSGHHITSVSQQQANGSRKVIFTTPNGQVDLAALPVIL